MILLGTWLLLERSGLGGPVTPMTGWKTLAEYDASWLCAQNLLLFLAERPWLQGAYLEGAIRCERAPSEGEKK